MKLLIIIFTYVSLAKADLNRALNLLSQCQPDTRFLDARVFPTKSFDDANLEERIKIIYELQNSRFCTDKKR